ncbi:acetyl-/propionyl-CoA carboxylase alpha subunit [Nocardia nova SH22a]|uniref:Acetyl-/propionyl-CoA carboxylase alpha subunit n=1 Tax=Nocardia nova SH22a TaxID=1415166 RepID=W5TKZ2_9NOCA|nr:biotin carboxylase N-terminal domain-containing protein [Nocardia nova]AHH19834.1 acetyl-/propionyl-CoA carboxylase alpha subunit [Nocardia nova SH22a]
MLKRVLIANRGEIAVRIARACRAASVECVGLYAAGEEPYHVTFCDDAVELPGGPQTYLDAAELVRLAIETRCDAVHPGYGYLAEDTDFARRATEAGMVFVGPSPDAIALAGDKVRARAAAIACGVPVVAASAGYVEDEEQVVRFGEVHGWPVLLKAANGGGGRGQRLVTDADHAAAALKECREEAVLAFGTDAVFCEQYLTATRHVEVQALADTTGGIVILGDRDCSVQRRNQKLLEEAPAPGLAEAVRAGLRESSRTLLRSLGYTGAGTVEFLVTGDHYYFMEINARIQVEHPVTEEIFGVDVVREQLRVASGEPLSVTEGEPRGHALEVRINAEDAEHGFIPSLGRLEAFSVPHAPGVRFDTGYRAGDVVAAHYDSLLGKLIVWGPDRAACLHRMLDALDSVRVVGVDTTAGLARAIVAHPDFASGCVTTAWLTERLERADLGPIARPVAASGIAAVPVVDTHTVTIAGRPLRVPVDSDPPSAAAAQEARIALARSNPWLAGASDSDDAVDASRRVVTSSTTGAVSAVRVSVGALVEEGDPLLVLEAMKMLVPIPAPITGRVTDIRAAVGDTVQHGETVAVVEIPAQLAEIRRQQ